MRETVATKTGMRIVTETVIKEKRKATVLKEVNSRLLLHPMLEENNPDRENQLNKENSSPDQESKGKLVNNAKLVIQDEGNKDRENAHNGIITADLLAIISPNLKERNLLRMTNLFKNRSIYLKGIILLFVASVLCACDKQTVYHSFQSLPNKGWLREDTLYFNVEIPDSLIYYKLSMEVRNRTNYPYQNLSLSICYDAPDAMPLPADTILFTLADNEGAWKGKGWGGLYQTAASAGSIQIEHSGTYRFKIAYTFPDESLQGINDIGLKIEK